MEKTLVDMVVEARRRPVSDYDYSEDKEHPTTDKNPQHREDFNSLLDAAVGASKQDH